LFSVTAALEETHGAQKLRKFDCNIAWVAYGCSIGGIATLVNLLIFLCQDFEIIYPNAPEISFGQWLIFALPLSLIMFVILASSYIMFPQKILRY
jgi:sodium-dependent dicarboxylate transporter 2/3/5